MESSIALIYRALITTLIDIGIESCESDLTKAKKQFEAQENANFLKHTYNFYFVDGVKNCCLWDILVLCYIYNVRINLEDISIHSIFNKMLPDEKNSTIFSYITGSTRMIHEKCELYIDQKAHVRLAKTIEKLVSNEKIRPVFTSHSVENNFNRMKDIASKITYKAAKNNFFSNAEATKTKNFNKDDRNLTGDNFNEKIISLKSTNLDKYFVRKYDIDGISCCVRTTEISEVIRGELRLEYQTRNYSKKPISKTAYIFSDQRFKNIIDLQCIHLGWIGDRSKDLSLSLYVCFGKEIDELNYVSEILKTTIKKARSLIHNKSSTTHDLISATYKVNEQKQKIRFTGIFPSDYSAQFLQIIAVELEKKFTQNDVFFYLENFGCKLSCSTANLENITTSLDTILDTELAKNLKVDFCLSINHKNNQLYITLLRKHLESFEKKSIYSSYLNKEIGNANSIYCKIRESEESNQLLMNRVGREKDNFYTDLINKNVHAQLFKGIYPNFSRSTLNKLVAYITGDEVAEFRHENLYDNAIENSLTSLKNANESTCCIRFESHLTHISQILPHSQNLIQSLQNIEVKVFKKSRIINAVIDALECLKNSYKNMYKNATDLITSLYIEILICEFYISGGNNKQLIDKSSKKFIDSLYTDSLNNLPETFCEQILQNVTSLSSDAKQAILNKMVQYSSLPTKNHELYANIFQLFFETDHNNIAADIITSYEQYFCSRYNLENDKSHYHVVYSPPHINRQLSLTINEYITALFYESYEMKNRYGKIPFYCAYLTLKKFNTKVWENVHSVLITYFELLNPEFLFDTNPSFTNNKKTRIMILNSDYNKTANEIDLFKIQLRQFLCKKIKKQGSPNWNITKLNILKKAFDLHKNTYAKVDDLIVGIAGDLRFSFGFELPFGSLKYAVKKYLNNFQNVHMICEDRSEILQGLEVITKEVIRNLDYTRYTTLDATEDGLKSFIEYYYISHKVKFSDEQIILINNVMSNLNESEKKELDQEQLKKLKFIYTLQHELEPNNNTSKKINNVSAKKINRWSRMRIMQNKKAALATENDSDITILATYPDPNYIKKPNPELNVLACNNLRENSQSDVQNENHENIVLDTLRVENTPHVSHSSSSHFHLWEGSTTTNTPENFNFDFCNDYASNSDINSQCIIRFTVDRNLLASYKSQVSISESSKSPTNNPYIVRLHITRDSNITLPILIKNFTTNLTHSTKILSIDNYTASQVFNIQTSPISRYYCLISEKRFSFLKHTILLYLSTSSLKTFHVEDFRMRRLARKFTKNTEKHKNRPSRNEVIAVCCELVSEGVFVCVDPGVCYKKVQ